VTVGISAYPSDGETVESLLEAAARALLSDEARRCGRVSGVVGVKQPTQDNPAKEYGILIRSI
jgi:hypothetical protein